MFGVGLRMKRLSLVAIAGGTTTLCMGLLGCPAWADGITPANDGTGTQVNQSGDDYSVTGGATSADEQNLFHSFSEFNLLTGESATFVTDPAILNILTRVTGGNPSAIDGLLQVVGSDANLFFVNPSGILFGPNSALNLQGSFTAVTADQINFSTGAFGTVGTPDYAALVGNPESYSFGAAVPGSIVNAGNLSVLPEEAVVLVGGQVLNTGTITTPGGDVAILAVEGGNLVRIEQEGLLLNLEVEALTANTQSPLLPFSPLSLPELLTGETAAIASGIAVNADGSITLTGSDVALPTEAGTAIVSGTFDARSEQGGNVTVLGETVGLLAATLDASGNTGGGTIRVGGDYKGEGPLPTAAVTFVDDASTLIADALTNGDGGRIVIWSDETTRSYGSISAQGGASSGDGGFVETSSHGFLDVQGIPNINAPNGQGGLWLLDPASIELVDSPETSDNIAIGDGVFSPEEPAAPSTLDLNLVNGALDTGDVTIETDASDIVGESDGSILLVDPFTFTSGEGNTLFINAASDIIFAEGTSLGSEVPGLNFNFQAVGQINLTGLTTQAGNISLEGAGISASEVLFSNGGSVYLAGSSGPINVVGIDTGVAEVDTVGGAIAINTPGIVQVGEDLISAGGDISVQGTSDGVAPGVNVDGAIASGGGGIAITGNSIAGSTAAAVSIGGAVTSEGGDIAVTGSDGAVEVISIDAAGVDGAGGAIAVTTQGAGVEGTPTLSASGPITTADAGTITLTSNNGSIAIQSATTETGAIGLIASGFIQVANAITTQSGSIAVQGNGEGGPSDISVTEPILSNGGDITLQSSDGTISVSRVDATAEVGGGNIAITSEAPDTTAATAISATGTVVTSGAGNIALNSPSGSIQIERAVLGNGLLSLIASGFINVTEDLTTQGGDVSVQGNDDGGPSEISVAAPITSNGGNIAVTSGDGAIAVNRVDAGGGTIQITPQGTDTTEAAALSSTGTIVTADDGTITLTSGGGINVEGLAAGSGPISAIATGLIQVAESLTTQGGNISLQNTGTASTVPTPAITVTAPIFSNGGEVTLSTSAGDVEVAEVNAGDPDATVAGGNVAITSPNFVRSTGSILTTGGAPITVTHGGNGNTPFTVGDSTTNGTTGSIANGTDAAPAQAFLDTVSFGDIRIVTNSPGNEGPTPIPDEVDQDEFECFGDCEDFENDFEGNDFEDGFQEDVDLDVELDNGMNGGGGRDNGGRDNGGSDGGGRDNGGRDNGGRDNGDIGDDGRGNDRDDGDFDRDDEGGFDDRDYRGDVEEIAYEDWEAGDGFYADDYVAYFDLPNIPEPSFRDSQDTLRSLTTQVGSPPALMYTRFVPAGSTNVAQKAADKTVPEVAAQPDDVLELVLVTPQGQPKRVVVSGATREKVIRSVRQLQIELTDRTRRRRTTYLSHAQQLYSWLVAPMEEALQEEDIAHVSFIMAPGLRSLPMAALHDGERFIIEKYTVGLMPSLALTDSRYTDIRQAPVLAMGASEFTNLPDLPAVPLELDTIVNQLRTGEKQLNEAFTPQTLVAQRQSDSYPILHLATHGEFRPGGPGNSFIQFWDQRLGLDQVRQLQLDSPTLELLVMSACRTALGDTDAELGFAGLAVQAGVKSALASLWQVSDLETAGLMAEFYTQLNQQPYKAEALRQAQLAMLRGEVRVEDGMLIWNGGSIPLPPELADLRFQDASHPYYWAAFTLVGSPW